MATDSDGGIMSEGPTATTLRRIAKAAAPPAPLTPARALRLALTRAAERSIALPLSVLSVREEEGPLDELLERLDAGLLILALRQDATPVGLVALDGEARAAAIEAQTLGQVDSTAPEPREPTAADAALARPLFEAFAREAESAVEGTSLAGWLRGPEVAERLPSKREATLLLPDGRYRAVRMSFDVGAGERQGLLLLLARLPDPPPPPLPESEAAQVTVQAQALRAQTRVEAILHRLELSLASAEALDVGQLLPLPGVTVASVRLESAGVTLGSARLGQVSGMRAVRIEAPFVPELGELPPLAGPPTGASLLPEPSWPANEEAPDRGPPEVMPME